MASAMKNLSEYDDSTIPSAKGLRIGIVLSEWNREITHALYQGCIATLEKHGADKDDIETIQVPGTFELPTGAKFLLSNKKLDAVICIGCVIKGETKHDEYISNAVATGLVGLGIASGTPCIFGVLTPNTHEQALERAGGKHGNKGVEAAVTAIRMAALKNEIKRPASSLGFKTNQ